MAPRLAGLVLLLLAACEPAPAPATPEADAPSPIQRKANATSALPPACVVFLSQLDCWLRRAGNEPEQVDIAVGTARATFESRPVGAPIEDTQARCERAMAGTRLSLEAIGCEDVHANASALPPADPVGCPPDQHFFIRRDGWVAGCHPDCATSADCPKGSSCSSIGTSPGGPIEDAFCE
jgi:hypothetical protein